MAQFHFVEKYEPHVADSSEVFPPELDLSVYRAYGDLKDMTDEQLIVHFRDHGRREGRFPNRLRHRGNFVEMVDTSRPVLEIGPFYNPQIVGKNVSYFDVLDTEALRARAHEMALDAHRTPKIDYLSPTGDLTIVNRRFHAVLSSHCIEHQPDLIRHLQHVAALLDPGGHYFLIVPDKNFCFDHYLPESRLSEVLDAFVEGRRVHSFKSVLEHRALVCHNDPGAHWSGDHGPVPAVTPEKLSTVMDEWQKAAGRYIDVHAWQFTPESFRTLLGQLRDLAFVNLEVERIYHTLCGRIEFFAILTKRT